MGVGALTAGGVQGFFGWLDRHNAARTSARLLYGDLLESRDVLARTLEEGDWRGRRSLAPALAAWETHRETLAFSLGTRDFHGVAGAMKSLDMLHAYRTANAALTDEGLSIVPANKIPDAIERIDTARLILGRTGRKIRERPFLRVRMSASTIVLAGRDEAS